jgi:FkbM family methyltransferase
MLAALKRLFRPRSPISPAEQKVLDEFSRELDMVARRVPMIKRYRRVRPYLRAFSQAGIDFKMIIYHYESQKWFDQDFTDAVLVNAGECNLVKPGDTVFDLGCNSGFISAWLAKRVGAAGKVVAFDPFPWNTLATRYTALLNGCTNVECHTVGIAGEAKEISIPYVDATIYGRKGVPQSRHFTAKLLPLDAFAHYRPNFIKVDIEGAERELLAGASTILSQKPRAQWLFEMHNDFIEAAGGDPDQVGRDLLTHGYTVRLHHAKVGPLFNATDHIPKSSGLFALSEEKAA